MLSKSVYLNEIERIMNIRSSPGHWCYYAVVVRGGAQIAAVAETEGGYHLLDAELFFGKNKIAIENEAHDLNSTRLDVPPAQSADIAAKAMALSAFKHKREFK